ncbi:pentatricopeptide-repeat-containing protein [Emydomyces testavorans]|uniref:Pentatricopeptide-repeat-containing protein n=1 Tax=Emydomyces testavorans TaxID=2070801 RepID=A0AAF0DF05_9EURO|nr:pentatricopeptide-repeat-containing protein [Emydomyces testavorans]
MFLVDGLWLCLRPSFSRFVITPATPPLSNKAYRFYRDRARLISSVTECQEQPQQPQQLPEGLSTISRANAVALNGDTILSDNPTGSLGKPPEHGVTRPKRPARRLASEPEEVYAARIRMRRRNVGSEPELQTKTTGALDNMLQTVVGDRPNHKAALRVLHELIERRHIKPELQHYRAIMLANADSGGGSAVHVKSILEEMEEIGVPLDSGTLHAALRALAIHPDYLLRQEILHTLRDRWLSLSPAGWHNLVTGLLRERQYELSLEKLEQMEVQGIYVKPWLYGLVVYNLADAEEFDEVLRLMESQVTAGEQFSANLWFHMLDKASTALHKGLASYIWKQQVLRGYLIPSYGVCSNILTICARTGDIELAVSVFDVLGQRNATFTLDDYESLLETYVTAGDIDTALRVLCMMEKTNIDVREDSTRSLLSSLVLSETGAHDIWEKLKRLRTEENKIIPVAAANLAIELCAHRGEMDEALNIYRELHDVCSSGPNTLTFNYLFSTCRKAERPDMASFFLQEMQLFKSLPTRSTYETLILLCVELSYFEEGHKYLLEMTQSGFALTEAAKEQIRVKCAQSENEFATRLQYDAAVRRPISRGFRRLTLAPLLKSMPNENDKHANSNDGTVRED